MGSLSSIEPTHLLLVLYITLGRRHSLHWLGRCYNWCHCGSFNAIVACNEAAWCWLG
jgi:hypothetical protein